jgi:hypothetical protein
MAGRLISNAISGESRPVTRQCVGVAVICPISFDLNLPIASQALQKLQDGGPNGDTDRGPRYRVSGLRNRQKKSLSYGLRRPYYSQNDQISASQSGFVVLLLKRCAIRGVKIALLSPNLTEG